MKKFKNKYYPIILIILISISILSISFLPYIINGKAFIYGYDLLNQWRPWFSEFSNQLDLAIQNKEIPFWSWNMFFGNNYFASKTFYFLTDIFQYLSYLIKDFHFFFILMFQIISKITLACITFSIYGYIRKFNCKTIVITSLMYGLSSYAIKFSDQSQMLYYYSLMPLFFCALELFMHNKYKYLFSITCCLLLVSNYYLFFSNCIFSIIYYTYRYYDIHKSYKYFIKNVFITIFYAFIGFMLAGFIIIPTIIELLGNDRVGNPAGNLLVYDSIKVYLHILLGNFVPSNIFIDTLVNFDGYQLYMNPYSTNYYNTTELVMFSSSITSLLLTQTMFDKEVKTSNRRYFIIISLFLFLPLLSSIMHGFSDSSFRWTMFYIFFNIVLVSRYINNPKLINYKVLLISTIVIILIVLINPIFTNNIINKMPFDNIKPMLMICIIPLIFLISYYFIFRFKFNYISLIILLTVELFTYTFIDYNSITHYSQTSFESHYGYENVLGKPNELNEYLKHFDNDKNEYYRLFVPKSAYTNVGYNQNLYYNYSDLSSYDSSFNYANNDLSKMVSDISLIQEHGWNFNIKESNLLDFTSAKYAVVLDESELPDDNFTFLADYYSHKIYKNNDYRPIASTYNQIISYKDYMLNKDTSLFNTHIITKDNDYNTVSKYLSNNNNIAYNMSKSLNNFNFKIDSNGHSFVVTAIGYNPGWNILVNDKEVDYYNVNGGFIGFPIFENSNVRMKFIPKGIRFGTLTSITGSIILLIIIIKDKFKSSNNI